MKLVNKVLLPALVALLLGVASSSVFAQQSFLSEQNMARLQELIDSPDRGKKLRVRNQYRHPLQTLDFFDVRPELTVAEIWPGGQGGWYRSILEPYMAGVGNYIPVMPDSEEPPFSGQVPDNSADRVLVFRAHGFMIYDLPAQDFFRSIYAMLKPGGIFGIVDHRGDESIPQDPKGTNGYVNQSHVIMLARNAGFELLDKAEINANSKDSKSHPNGVYSLPPTLKGSLLNRRLRAEMLEVGESDRMTLKFIKM
jgi:predicted methyltransferase